MKARKQPKGGARKRPSPVPPPSAFEKAHTAWLAARLAINACSDTKEAEIARLLDAQRSAEWRLIRTNAPTLLEIRQRAAFVQTIFTDAAMIGRPTDNRDHAALAVLVAEIQRVLPQVVLP
jgi:hypothetical protein